MLRLHLNPYRIDFCEKQTLKNYEHWTISKIQSENLKINTTD